MNGAESLIETATSAGVEVCFANPGTTELSLVAALDSVSGMRAILGLFEGVCTGAADGYGRMTGKPALTLLHLGPGFANGIANLHNARRARSPVVNLIGDHAIWHRAADAPLTSDIAGLAAPVSAWVRSSSSATDLANDGAAAIAAALRPPGQVATLIVPSDCQWEPATGPAPPPLPVVRAEVCSRRLDEAVAALTVGKVGKAILLIGGEGLTAEGLTAAGRIRAATGCRVYCEGFAARMERGGGLPAFERWPYFPETALKALSGADALVLVGAAEPVAFFGYPGLPSRLLPEGCVAHRLAEPREDATAALVALAESLGAPPPKVRKPERPRPPRGELNPESLGCAVAALQPEGTIIADEANTSGLGYDAMASAAPHHTVLSLTGGSIGQGLPVAVGAAVACPDRKVIALQADGSGMYTLQSLWTMAREGLDVTVIVCANQSYRILQIEMMRAGIASPGTAARSLTDLTDPRLGWVELAAGMGVPGSRVDTADALVTALNQALSEAGPVLIEAKL